MSLQSMFDVSGKSVIVTGGASGIGRAYAEIMVEMGAHVRILDMDAAGLDATVFEIAAHDWPGTVSGAQLDVSDREALTAAFDTFADAQGRIDVVFANAGVDAGPGFLTPEGERCPEGQIDAMPEEQWDRVIDVNLTGVFMTIRNAARHMKATGGGRIIVTSSVAARVNETIVGTAYMPAKAGVDHLVRNAAMELAAHGILVNCISPGPFITNIAGGRLKNKADREAFEAQSLMGRIAYPDEIKGLALFLASPASSYVTGAQMTIDGGSSLRG
jgi:NAD(P)-dependent dehydrogenase (short-subunit alcohol dehydrogenase family)